MGLRKTALGDDSDYSSLGPSDYGHHTLGGPTSGCRGLTDHLLDVAMIARGSGYVPLGGSI